MRTVGADDSNNLKTVDLFMSHEGLLLDYESCLTRSINNKYYNLGTHFLWIGDRTRDCKFLFLSLDSKWSPCRIFQRIRKSNWT